MRIGLITDTHVPEAVKKLPAEIAVAFAGVDLILHAGDIYDRMVLDELERIAPVYAARGDDDYLSERGDKRVKDKHVLNLDGATVWLMHELPSYYSAKLWQSRYPFNYREPDPLPEAAPDVIVFGHEHRVILQQIDNCLLVNSGSATLLYYRHGLGTVAILETGRDKPTASVIQLQDLAGSSG
jgi:putative phosphoesterase